MKPSLQQNSIIYLACPANYATGGTELLHQLANKLNSLGRTARIYYYNNKQKDPVHPQFADYKVPYVKKIVDTRQHLLLVPEGKTNFLKKFRHIQKAIWWLSIDFYFHTRDEKIFWFVRRKVRPILNLADMAKKYKVDYHFVQSYYASHYLSKFNLPSFHLSDYLNRQFLHEAKSISYSNRENQVLYNPKKGLAFTTQLIQLTPDLKWVPLQNLSVSQVAELFKTSKVYVDFGNHPGKDRFPREAAVMGCIVITNKQGAAAFAEDLPIPEEYKFSDTEINSIILKIRESLTQYEKHVSKFDTYRNFIHTEEAVFTEQVKSLFL
ncbi:MAG: hypothetical protein KF775_11030 [Cyclobacteriaceae bacterium]|nr:hypothetical protein [Cyclobacteriaceae bacterium]